MTLLSCFLALLVLGACTVPNKAKCCLTQEECRAVGIDEPRGCDPGLACVDSNCLVPICSTDGCAPTAPICDTTIDTCVGCTDVADCARFPDQSACNIDTGSCVECIGPADCTAAEPVCDANVCRLCTLDSECASGACADDGGCVVESGVLYLHPTGSDAGSCTGLAPCATLSYASSMMSAGRTHFVMAPGTYNVAADNVLTVGPTTPAPSITIHGGGAKIVRTQSTGGPMLSIGIPATIRDLDLVSGPTGTALSLTKPTTLERLSIQASFGIGILAPVPVTARDIAIDAGTQAVAVTNGTLTLDRAVLHGGVYGIMASNGATVDASNVLIYDTSDVGIEFSAGTVSGSLSFVTIADTGVSSTTAAGLACLSPNALSAPCEHHLDSDFEPSADHWLH